MNTSFACGFFAKYTSHDLKSFILISCTHTSTAQELLLYDAQHITAKSKTMRKRPLQESQVCNLSFCNQGCRSSINLASHDSAVKHGGDDVSQSLNTQSLRELRCNLLVFKPPTSGHTISANISKQQDIKRNNASGMSHQAQHSVMQNKEKGRAE